ncbi:MAG: hypothetical protein AB7S38_09310 [Vulcanimicrobiota bacterium]
MNVKGYVQSFPVFSPWNRERYHQWQERVDTLDEAIDLAAKIKAPESDLTRLRDYRSVIDQGLDKSRSNDRNLSIIKAVTHAGAFGFVGGFFSIFHAHDLASMGMRTGIAIACGAAMVGGELLFRSLLAQGKACGDEPQASLDALGPGHAKLVAEYLVKADSTRQVLNLADALKVDSKAIVNDGDTVDIGGFLLDIVDDEPTVRSVNLPPKDPRF